MSDVRCLCCNGPIEDRRITLAATETPDRSQGWVDLRREKTCEPCVRGECRREDGSFEPGHREWTPTTEDGDACRLLWAAVVDLARRDAESPKLPTSLKAQAAKHRDSARSFVEELERRTA